MDKQKFPIKTDILILFCSCIANILCMGLGRTSGGLLTLISHVIMLMQIITN